MHHGDGMAELAAAACGWGSSHTGRSEINQGIPGFAVLGSSPCVGAATSRVGLLSSVQPL